MRIWRASFFIVVVLLGSGSCASQPTSRFAGTALEELERLHMEVATGIRDVNSLTPKERNQVAMFGKMVRRLAYSENISQACQEAVEEAEHAQNELEEELGDLKWCVGRQPVDGGSDCDRNWRRVEQLRDTYERRTRDVSWQCSLNS